MGEGGSLAGDWNGLEWGNRCYFLKIDAVVNGGAVDLGMSKVVGVPFAKASGDWANVGDSILYRNDVNVGIGTPLPQARLHIYDTDVNLSGGGGILLGKLDGTNLAIDQNEIMARNSGGIGC